MRVKILLVDDHQMITSFYETALGYSDIDTVITVKNTLESAYKFIFEQFIQQIEIVFLDLSMPAYIEKGINNGEDFAKLLRKKYPKIKIIILSSIFSVTQLDRIIKHINPEGLIEKTDLCSYDHIVNILNKVINGEFYRSLMIEESITKNPYDFYLDSINKQIIILISKGIKTKDIPSHLSMTLSGVKKRKLKIKRLLKIDFGNDEDIIRESKILGII